MHRATSHAPSVTAEHLIEASSDAIVVVDGRGRIRLANRRAHTLFGFVDPLAGRHIDELIPDTLAPIASDDLLRVKGRRRDGATLALDVRVAPLGEGNGFVHVTCRPSPFGGEGGYAHLLDHVPDAIMAVDAEGLIRFVNQRCEALFGYASEELVGESMNVLAPERTKTSPTGRMRVKFFARQPEGANLELFARRKDGTEIATDISLSTVVTDEGVLVLASVRDVTGRKRLESERDDVEAMLLADERGIERAAFEMQLHQAQRLESIGRLAGGIAHDFNNLLGVIMMYASFVDERLGSGDADVTFTGADIVAMQSDVLAVKEVAGRAAALTHKLLTFGRREVVALEVLDVNDVVRSMEDLLSRTMGENVDDLRTVLADHALHVEADRGQLDQVVMNLAVNARDAMLGGGTLTVTTREVSVSDAGGAFPAADPGRYAGLAVSDTGGGMSREVAARAFDPFFTTKGSASGSGLGLATVYGIVKQAGGEVTIDSTLGVGTTVTVLLPLTEEPLSASRKVSESPTNVDGHETVLLVEDEAMFQQPATRILTAHGYHVLAAANAGDALEQAREHQGDIHLLVTDIVMPGPSGQELARELVHQRPSIRVLFMSGYGWEAFDRDGPSGSARLLDKPFAATELLRSVRLALDEQ